MIINKLQEDLKNAQLARKELTVSVIRMLLSEIKYAEIAKGNSLADNEIVSVIQKEVKKRNESATAFHLGKREDLATKEEAEAEILKTYLPTQLSDEELLKIVEQAITEVGASSVSDMGKVIGLVMGRAEGKADGGRVSSLVKEKLLNK